MTQQAIPENLRTSKALQYVVSKGWNFQGDGSGGQVQIEECPFCKHGSYKFYLAVANPAESSRDGLFFCHAGNCQKTGNLRTLMESQGDRIPGVDSRKEWAGNGTSKPDSLPDVETCHRELLGDAEAMSYLLNERGFTKKVIEQQKLGLKAKVWFRETGESTALVIPYLVDGNIVYAKYRTLPPKPKDFISPAGWEAGLYNSDVLNEACKELIMVEGEADCLSLLSHGVNNVVGIPGAGVRKATWIEALDRINPKIYILFDADSAGAKGSQALASRIGIEKCLKIVLPKGTKDINDFFCKGGTIEEFEALKKEARLFDISGVSSSLSALEQLESELSGKVDLAPTYRTQWAELNRLVGFEKNDVVDIMGAAKQGKSTMALNLLDHMSSTYGEDALYVCLEMSQARLARKWVSLVTGFEDMITEPGTDASKAKLQELKDAVVKAKEIQQNRSGEIFFAYPQVVKEPEDIFKLIKDCIRRYGVKFIVFDNLQLLCDSTLGNRQGFRTVHLSQISKGFARIAKDYDVVLFRILQPKKIDKSSIISVSDIDGSSQIDKDTDCLINIWRRSIGGEVSRSVYDEEQGLSDSVESFDPKMRVTVALSRYSSGGHCHLLFDGARSQVRSYDTAHKALASNQRSFNGILLENGTTTPVVPTEESPTYILPTEGITI